MNDIVGAFDIVMITLDTLRYDVAQKQFLQGATPVLEKYLPASGWELRHTPGTFTFAAHCAFFAGFLPTPAIPGSHPRLFALRFAGSETTDANTHVFPDHSNIVEGLAKDGYQTICIGGVGFFNMQNALGNVLPLAFREKYWRPEFSVMDPRSTENQVTLACERLNDPVLANSRVFLFMNIAAIHQPNAHYLPGATEDDLASHGAALSYVDRALAPLWDCLKARAPTFVMIFSDHGTAYGEGGYLGHRIAHDVVTHVPYAHFVIAKN